MPALMGVKRIYSRHFLDDQRSCDLTISGSQKLTKRRTVVLMRQLCGVHLLVKGTFGSKYTALPALFSRWVTVSLVMKMARPLNQLRL